MIVVEFWENQNWFRQWFVCRRSVDLDNGRILIISVFNKDQNHDYYNISLEKCSNQVVRKYWDVIFW